MPFLTSNNFYKSFYPLPVPDYFKRKIFLKYYFSFHFLSVFTFYIFCSFTTVAHKAGEMKCLWAQIFSFMFFSNLNKIHKAQLNIIIKNKSGPKVKASYLTVLVPLFKLGGKKVTQEVLRDPSHFITF